MCTWTGADTWVLVHFCIVSEVKIIATRCAPKIRIPEPGTPVDTEETPDPQSFSSSPWSYPIAPASSCKGVYTPVLTSNGLSLHTLQILVAAPWSRGVHTGRDLGIEPDSSGKWAFGCLGKKLRVLTPREEIRSGSVGSGPGGGLETGIVKLLSRSNTVGF